MCCIWVHCESVGMSLVVKGEKGFPAKLFCDNVALHPQSCKDLLGVATILAALTHCNHVETHVLVTVDTLAASQSYTPRDSSKVNVVYSYICQIGVCWTHT